jgi:hypothetical protein
MLCVTGVEATGEARVQLRDCLVRHTGLMEFPAVWASDATRIFLDACRLVHNQVGVHVGDAAAVEARGCELLLSCLGAFRSEHGAHNASLAVHRCLVRGPFPWAGDVRPGRVVATNNSFPGCLTAEEERFADAVRAGAVRRFLNRLSSHDGRDDVAAAPSSAVAAPAIAALTSGQAPMEADGGSALGRGAHGEAPVAPPLGSAEGRGGVNAPGQDSGSEMEEATDGSEMEEATDGSEASELQDPGASESGADSDESIAEPGVDRPGSHPHAELGGEWVPWGGGGGAPEGRPGRAVRGAQGPRLWQGFPDLTSRLWELLKADGVAEAAEALKARGPRGMVELEEEAKTRGMTGLAEDIRAWEPEEPQGGGMGEWLRVRCGDDRARERAGMGGAVDGMMFPTRLRCVPCRGRFSTALSKATLHPAQRRRYLPRPARPVLFTPVQTLGGCCVPQGTPSDLFHWPLQVWRRAHLFVGAHAQECECEEDGGVRGWVARGGGVQSYR